MISIVRQVDDLYGRIRGHARPFARLARPCDGEFIIIVIGLECSEVALLLLDVDVLVLDACLLCLFLAIAK